MNEPVLAIDRLRILDTIVSAEIGAGELVAVVGPNRSGKTTLAEILRGSVRDVAGTVRRTVDIRDIAYSAYSADGNLFHYADFYYQQRYNTFDDAAVDTVNGICATTSRRLPARPFAAVLPPSILQTKLIELSSGETRKTLLLKNLFREAKVYILDNPLSGLDEASGAVFLDVFGRIARRYRKTVILLLADPPAGVAFDRVIRLNRPEKRKAEADVRPVLPPAFLTTPPADFEIVLALEKETLTIASGSDRDLSWRIRPTARNGFSKAPTAPASRRFEPAYRRNPLPPLRFLLFDRKRERASPSGTSKRASASFPQTCNCASKARLASGRHPFGFFRHGGAEPAHHRRGSGPLPGDCRGSGVADLQNGPFGRLSSGERSGHDRPGAGQNPPVLILDNRFRTWMRGVSILHSFLAQCADGSNRNPDRPSRRRKASGVNTFGLKTKP